MCWGIAIKKINAVKTVQCHNKKRLQSSKLVQVSAPEFLTAEFMVTDKWTLI